MPPDSYGRYLLSKRTVDDRSLNRHVLKRFRAELRPRSSLRVVEIGAGLGTMVARLVDWQFITRAEYALVDVDAQLLADARAWLLSWAAMRGFSTTRHADELVIQDKAAIEVKVRFICAEIGAFLGAGAGPSMPGLPPADVLVANAFLDLVDVPTMLPHLFDLVVAGGLYWFSINFDGETIFEPEHPDDGQFLRVYHRSMDERVRYGRRAGESKCGRRLFAHLHAAGATILAAGASDWVVHGQNGVYGDDEGYFLHRIVDTVGAELRQHPEIGAASLSDWLTLRHAQIDRGELVYLAHQIDFVGRRP